MKVIKTVIYCKQAQQVYNPDVGEFEDANDQNYEWIDNGEGELPEITPEDIGTKIPMEDNTEEELKDVEPIEEDQDKYPKFSRPIEYINYAIQNKEVIRVSYTTVKGDFIIRDIEPHGIFNAKTTGNQIVVAWNENMDWYGGFVIDQIQKVEWKGEQFTPKFNFRAERNRFLGRMRQRKYRKKNKQRFQRLKEL